MGRVSCDVVCNFFFFSVPSSGYVHNDDDDSAMTCFLKLGVLYLVGTGILGRVNYDLLMAILFFCI